jgi:hypothetical protein
VSKRHQKTGSESAVACTYGHLKSPAQSSRNSRFKRSCIQLEVQLEQDREQLHKQTTFGNRAKPLLV